MINVFERQVANCKRTAVKKKSDTYFTVEDFVYLYGTDYLI